MSEKVNVQLFTKDYSGDGWTVSGVGFDVPAEAIPRIGDAVRYKRDLWRVLDAVWDFSNMGLGGSGVYTVDLHVELGTE